MLNILWPTLQPETEIETTQRLSFLLLKVECYLANTAEYICWRRRLLRRGWKGAHLFMYDLTVLELEHGHQVRVLLNPLSRSVQEGRLTPGTTFMATKIMRCLAAGGDGLTGGSSTTSYLVIQDWREVNTTQAVHITSLETSARLCLEGYARSRHLCNATMTLCSLCPWTLSSITDNISIAKLQRCSDPAVLPPALRLGNYRPEEDNIRRLAEGLTDSRRPPLLLRVLARSKTRTFFRQENSRKPVSFMATLLVGDVSGTCKAVFWDEAALALTETIWEGDLLLLGRDGYEVGRYQPGKAQPYRLEPKSGLLGLQPLPIEIKVNTRDLTRVCALHPVAGLSSAPPPLWKFYTVKQLQSQTFAEGLLLDLVGFVTYLGRWEREPCCHPDTGQPTGQYWVRVWLRVTDHTGMNWADPHTLATVAVRIYLDQDRWQAMKTICPLVPCVITHLRYVKEAGVFTQLDCTNETQVFVGGKALISSRFSNSEIVQEFRKFYHDEDHLWEPLLSGVATFGGRPLLGRTLLDRAAGPGIQSKDQLIDFLDTLSYRGGGRLSLQGSLLSAVELEAAEDGSLAEVGEVQFQVVPESLLLVDLGTITWRSLLKSTEGLSTDQLTEAVRTDCLLEWPQDASPRGRSSAKVVTQRICRVQILLKNCVLCCLCSILPLVHLEEMVQTENLFLVDFFRLEPAALAHPSQGAEAFLRLVEPLSREEAASGTHHNHCLDDSTDGNTTLDIFKEFAEARAHSS